MTEIDKLKELVNMTIVRLFLIVFPPIGEKSFSQIDIRVGMVIKEKLDFIYVIGTDLDNLWSPKVTLESIPRFYFSGQDFGIRIDGWMNQQINDEIALEYYDVTNSIDFKDLIEEQILGIQLMSIQGNPMPFGVKFLFHKDFIMSFPNSDGNTIETKVFNRTESFKHFEYLGDIIYSELG